MFHKKTIYLISIIAIIQIGTQNAMAHALCGNRTAGFTGSSTVSGDITADSCLEIGADNFDNKPYIGMAIDANLLPGSRLSINGKFKNSVVHGDGNFNSDGSNYAEVWITKKPVIAWDAYDERRPALGENIKVDGGLVRVLNGGTLKDSIVKNNGHVYVTGSTKDSQGNVMESGISIDNTVSDGGILYAFAGGKSFGTVVNKGGVEYVQTEGKTNRTVVNAGGLQRVITEGVASNTEIKEDGMQYVYDNGIADGTIVYGKQYVFTENGLATNTQVYGEGQQIVQDTSKAENVVIHDSGVQALYGSTTATNVTLNDNSRSWLNFNTKILGQTNINDNGQLQLTAGETGTGAYAEKVNLNSQNSSILVIANKNDNDAVSIGELNGSGKIGFANTTTEPKYSTLNINKLSGNHHFYFNTSIADGRTDYLFITEGSGSHKVSVADSGAEITKPNEMALDLITDQSQGAEFNLVSVDGTNINAVDGGTYVYHLANRYDTEIDSSIWYLTAGLEEPGLEEPGLEEPGLEEPGLPPALITTPSTDAMLSMSSAPVLIMQNELSNLRFRKGELKVDSGTPNIWGRIIGNKSTVDSKQMQYKLKQKGIELGVDKTFNVINGLIVVGTFANYSSSDINHKRGGTSTIDSLGLGVYARYVDTSNIYLDATLKYSYFKNKVSAVSTNGSKIDGRYNQNGIGATLEVGYHHALSEKIWVEPYAQLSYIYINGSSTTLSNNMYADIGHQHSFGTELGGYIGKDFSLKGNTRLRLYGKVAWRHNFKSNNYTEINKLNQFNTSLSGDLFKLGVGVNTQPSNGKLNFYTELNYTKGNKVKSPVTVSIGVRYKF